MLKTAVLIGISACLLSACAVKPKGPKFSEVQPVAKPAHGLVIIYRTLAEPTINDVDILLDEQRVEILRDNTFVTLDVTPGKHKFTSDWSAFAGQRDSTIELDIAAGHTYYLVVTAEKVVSGYAVIPGVTSYVEFDNKSDILQVEATAAERAIEQCCVKFGMDSMVVNKKH